MSSRQSTVKSVAIDLTKSGNVATTDHNSAESAKRERRGAAGADSSTLLRMLMSSACVVAADALLMRQSVFALLYVTVALGTLAYAIACDSLALMADACHMFMACSTLLVR